MDFTLSKYNPEFRIDGVYCRDEWTDYSDIGCEFPDGVLTKKEYQTVESQYLSALLDILNKLDINAMEVRKFECNNNGPLFLFRIFAFWGRLLRIVPPTHSKEKIILFARNCLRNRYWGELYCDQLTVWFGYDYYMNISCSLTVHEMQVIAETNHLYVEQFG